MKLKKLIAMGTVLTLCVALLSGCGSSENNEKDSDANKTKKYVLGTNPTFAPFEFQDDDGTIKGFDIDLVKAIGEEEGFEIEVKQLGFDALTAAVKNGEIDIIASGMSITPERCKQLVFSKPYMDASLGVFVADDNTDITSIDSLKGKKVAAQVGTTGAETVEEMAKDKLIGTSKILEDYNMCFLELGNGGANAVIIDLPVAQAYMDKQPKTIKQVGDAFATDYYGIAVAPDNKELAEIINSGLDKLIKNGKYAELCKKYGLGATDSILKGTAKVEGVEK